MIGKKVLSSVAGIVVVAALSFGASRAFAKPTKAGFAPGCTYTPGCVFGGNGTIGGTRICCQPN
ncbi:MULTISPECIES: hypothetical protein [unclassified Stenotrophomonas]|uniref:hypothetical protein n=1 Tax=unclassified Stenotrophomonas TaxID=196198 RepID=UPI003BF882AC